MKKYTLTVSDGKGGERGIKVRLDDETSRLLEEAGDPELTRAYIIEEYKSRNMERKETRRHVSLDKSMERGMDIADPRIDVYAAAERNEDRRRLHNALRRLTDKQRAVFLRYVLDGLSFREIGEELGIAKNVAREHYYAAIKKLKKFF